VLPVAAETITTDTNGLVAGDVSIPVQGGTMPGYRAMPAGKGPFPTVLVVQEVFGVHEHIKDLCRRLAKTGYYAVAPELYFRQGDPQKAPSFKELMPIVNAVPDAQVMADLDATAAFAKASGSADTARLAITGFCWGGRIVWLYAAHNPALKAGVAWYGRLAEEPTALQPRNALDLVPQLKAPVLGLYAGLDKNISVADVEKMKAALKAAGSKSDIVLYPQADHGFNADYRPSYKADDAKDAWARMLAWFKQNGVA
jgi:carboxymethylenebutenolidase